MRTALLAIWLTACSTPADEGTTAGDCEDGRDNDGDELTDCDDPGCAASAACEDGPDDEPDSLSLEAYIDQATQVICEILVECFELYDSVDTCLSEVGEPGECLDYDAQAAAACVQAFRQQLEDCPADLSTWEVPPVCGEVCEVPDTGF